MELPSATVVGAVKAFAAEMVVETIDVATAVDEAGHAGGGFESAG